MELPSTPRALPISSDLTPSLSNAKISSLFIVSRGSSGFLFLLFLLLSAINYLLPFFMRLFKTPTVDFVVPKISATSALLSPKRESSATFSDKVHFSGPDNKDNVKSALNFFDICSSNSWSFIF